MIPSIYEEKAFDKIKQPFPIKKKKPSRKWTHREYTSISQRLYMTNPQITFSMVKS